MTADEEFGAFWGNCDGHFSQFFTPNQAMSPFVCQQDSTKTTKQI